MPSQHIGTFLTEKEMERVELALKKAKIKRYGFLKNAIKHECEAILNEKENEKSGESRQSGEEGNSGRDGQTSDERRTTEVSKSDAEEFFNNYLRTA